MSDSDKIATAFVKACADLRGAEINAVNSHLKSGYSDLSSVQAAARAALIPHGLAWYQQVVQQDGPGDADIQRVHARVIRGSADLDQRVARAAASVDENAGFRRGRGHAD